jgi:hypothetical protein
LIVVYRPRLPELRAAIEAVVDCAREGVSASLRLWYNDAGPEDTPGLGDAIDAARACGLSVIEEGKRGNLGFGRAVNAALPGILDDFILLLNQDAIPEPGALRGLLAEAHADEPDVAAWEMRQIPYEHPKDYDPVTGETGWCSGAALLLRTTALRDVAGFEPRFFMYGEDVDLSWRLRCAGWRLRYRPRHAAVHHAYREPGEIKPLASTQGAYANLCLRARYAGRRHVIDGLRQVATDIRAQEPFEGHRKGLLSALLRFAGDYRYFRRTRCTAPGFEPCLRGRDYEMRREGAFIPYRSAAERAGHIPTVSVLVRAGEEASHLAEWLTCIAGQTHPPVEVILVGGTKPAAARIWQSAHHPFETRPLPALASPLDEVARVHATGDWWLTMEDDSLLPYADHIEVLLDAALAANADMAAAWTWNVEADDHQRRHAHRQHMPRSIAIASIFQRPSRLTRRHARPDQPTSLRTVDVGKVTTVRYGRPRAEDEPIQAPAMALPANSSHMPQSADSK